MILLWFALACSCSRSVAASSRSNGFSANLMATIGCADRAGHREGASAYLNRQYTTIGIVGVVLTVVLFVTLGWLHAVGFLIVLGVAGYYAILICLRGGCRRPAAHRWSAWPSAAR